MAVGDLYNLTCYVSSAAESASIVLGYKQTGGSNDAKTLKSACEFFAANQMLILRNCLSDQVDITQVDMYPVTPNNETPGINPFQTLPGARSGASLSFGAAAVATKITDAPNSRFNGRMYTPGILEGDQAEGTLSAPILALLVLWNAEILKTLQTSLPQTATFEAVVISRFDNKIPRVPPVGFNVDSMVQRVHLKQQRRRITRERGFSS